MDKPVKPWIDKLSENDFVTENMPYTEGKYYHLFEERLYKTGNDKIGDIRYYIYDPTKHGYPVEGKYPVIYSFHGASASLYGMTAINWAGVEYYASEEYQEKMGGAYIICPLANEYAEGDLVKLTWMTAASENSDNLAINDYEYELIEAIKKRFGDPNVPLLDLLGKNSIYTESLYGLFNEAVNTFTSAGKTIVFGTSAGGYCAYRYILTYKVDAALIMAPAYLPSAKELDILDERETRIWLCHGRYDELVPYDFAIMPALNRMKQMKNLELFLPEFVRMPDYGIYSNPAGVEMGQHCINNAVQCDLMFNDGKPMDEAHKNGVTGWVREISA